MAEESQIVLDESLTKTKEIVYAVQQLQKQQEDADRKANKELRAHADAKHKIKALEMDQLQTRQAAEAEVHQHTLSREKYEKEGRAHTKTMDALQAAKDDVTSMRLQMDAMKVEMEAQRKAFVINVNWAARCTELKTKFDLSCNEYDTLLEKHVKAKAEVDAALRAQEEFKAKYQSASEAFTTAQEEIARQALEITNRNQVSDDIATKLAELDEFRAKLAQDEVRKKLGSQQALSVLQRNLAKGDAGLVTSAFSGWSSITVSEKKQRLHKDRAMQRAVKTIATDGQCLLAEVFKEWKVDADRVKKAALMAAAKRLEEASGIAGAGNMTGRSRAIAQLEKQFKGEDVALQESCFQGWALGQVARKKKDQNHKKASRLIANSGMALCAEVVGLWNDLTEKRRKKNRQSQANMHSAGRMIANSAKALQTDVFLTWWGWIEGIRLTRKAKEAGTAKAMRMMANSSASLMNLCFDSWAKFRKESKKKASGNNKALRMVADSNQAIIIAVWQAWSQEKKTASAKEANTARAVRMINNSSEAMRAACYQAWASYCRNNRDKNRKIRALEKSFGAQDAGRKLVVFSSWQSSAKVEGRRKRAKELSMKTAVKSITGNRDLLLCHLILAWGRYAGQLRTDKLRTQTAELETALKVSVEEARLAVEQDLVKAKKQVEDMTAELEAKKQERDSSISSLSDLESRLEQASAVVEDLDRQVNTIGAELDQSRRKAKDIGEELGKVGIFISMHSPRKTSRTGTGASHYRPLSGNKPADHKLPPIDGRPSSGTSAKDGSKSARGVAGERGGSGRSRDGRPPAHPGNERRLLVDGSGPFSYAEFQEIYGDRSREVWNSCSPEVGTPVQQDTNYADY